MQSPSRHRADDHGAVAVEFALIVPIVLMLLFGMITAALAYNDHLSISNATREGARLGGALDYSTGASAWADSVQTRVQQTYFNSGSSLPVSAICVKLVSSAGATLASPSSQGTSCGTEPSAPTGMSAGTCAVKVWVSKQESIQLVVAPTLNFSIGAQSVSYYGRTAGSCTSI